MTDGAPDHQQRHEQPQRAAVRDRGEQAAGTADQHRAGRGAGAAEPVAEPAGHAGSRGRRRARARRTRPARPCPRDAGSPRLGEAGGEERRRPRPQGVELPHVAEVAEVGQPRRPGPPHVERRRRDGSPAERATSGPTTDPALQHRGDQRQAGRDDERRTPRRAEGAGDQLRQDAAERERADHDAHRQAAPVGEPADDQLHADRVDQRQRRAGDHAQRHRRRRRRRRRWPWRASRARRRRRPSPISRGGCTRSGRLVTAETSAPVDEAELHPDRQQRLADPPDLPLVAQRRRGRGRREPGRDREHLDRGDQRQLAYGDRPVGPHRGARPARLLTGAAAPSRTSWVTCSGDSSSRVVTPSSRIVRSTWPREDLDRAVDAGAATGHQAVEVGTADEREPSRRGRSRRRRPGRT